jgi:probable O-glycosylation ligase (exosortase A-associated)
MGLRDILVFGGVFALLPMALFHPYIGVLLWAWLGIMNPHRLAFGLAHDFPFSQAVAAATLIGLVITRDERRFKPSAEVWVLMAFIAWFTFTTFFAMNHLDAWPAWQRALKIQLLTFIGLFVLQDRRHVELLLWVVAASLAYYGTKGGVFTILHAGNFLVWGPQGSFIEDNNALALAQVVNIPLLYYLYLQSTRRWVRIGLLVSMPLCAIAALGSHSRGAALAITAMTLLLWVRTRHKFRVGLMVIAVAAVGISMLPERWFERMETIRTYDTDQSAMGRITAWETATRLAFARPLGGGFEFHTQDAYAKYGPPGAENFSLAMHSIWFQVLGEHGFIGLGLFTLFWFLVWRTASTLIRAARDSPEHAWAGDLGRMAQVSLIGYLVGGTFLSLAYWDVPYYLMVALVVAKDALARSRVPAAATQPSAHSMQGAAADAAR